MVTQYDIKLAVHLLSVHFGNLVAKVCEHLLRRGPLTLEQLIRFTELAEEQVKNSLLVLIQQNCVQAFIPKRDGGDREGSKVCTQYLALSVNILHRTRFSKFLEIVYQELDVKCVEVVDILLRDGRLTLEQIVDRACQRKETPVAMDDILESLNKLLMVRYIERCPAPEPDVSPPVAQNTKKRGAESMVLSCSKRVAKSKLLSCSKQGAKFETNEVPDTIEQCVLEAAVPVEGIRFSLVANTELNTGRVNDSDDCPMMSVGENVAQEYSTLFRANFEELIRPLWHKVLIENVRTRLGDEAAIILGAIMEATRTAGIKRKMGNSVPLTLDTIFTEVVKTEYGRTMTIDHVKSSLVQLGCLQNMSNDACIDLRKIIELARDEEVESIVLKRYGRDAYRIFRLLSKADRFLETDKIAESTLVAKKVTPKILCKLWKDDYLHMEKLVVTGARQSKFSLWKVDKPTLWEYVRDEMYHAALNLNLRLAYEQEKDEELLNVPKDKIVGQLRKRYERLRGVWLQLESSLMTLDNALMLFHDF